MISKNTIVIPAGVTYLTDLPDGFDFHFETGIYAKELTGCGATTYALRNEKMNVVLFVPRKTLLLNKAEQTEGVQMVYGDICDTEIMNYVKGGQQRKVFICTFDSAARLRRFLGDSWEGYHLYIDEFHCLLNDASFKSYTELSFIDTVRDAEHQTWLSATPCLDEFIERMPHLSSLPFYQLEWTEKEKVEIERFECKNPVRAACRVINEYMEGRYPTMLDDEGKVVAESKTMNLFLSSVNNLASVVNQCGLTPENTCWVVSPTDENVESLRKMSFEIGKIPLKGEERKMFTICTSTAYMGMDFYGTDTCTFVVADCKKPNTSVDIQTELVQICGRERLEENPFRKSVVFIYNSWEGESSLDARLAEMDEKKTLSQEETELFNNAFKSASQPLKDKLINTIKTEKKVAQDKKSYTYWDESTEQFRINELSVLSDEYEARVQYHIYHDGTFIFRNLSEQSSLTVSKDVKQIAVTEYVKNVTLKTSFAEKMETYCNYREEEENNPFNFYFMNQLQRQLPQLEVFYDTLGADRIRALGYKEQALQDAMNVKKSDLKIQLKLESLIKKGDEKTSDEWKEMLNQVYQDLGLKKKGVRTHLEKLYGYKMEKHHRTDKDGKRFYTYEIV